MEYSLTMKAVSWEDREACLNPYSNGILSDLHSLLRAKSLQYRLNPCSNGILSDAEGTVFTKINASS